MFEWEPTLPRFQGNVSHKRLEIILRLWTHAKEVLSTETLQLAAGPLLTTVAQMKLVTEARKTKDVMDALVALCTELCLCGGTDGLNTYQKDPDRNRKEDLWTVIAQAWAAADAPQSWKDVAALVSVPYQYAQ